MLNPWVILTVVLLWGSSLAGSYFKGVENGKNGLIAEQKKEEDIRRETREDAQKGAADAIAQIEIKNTTINRRVEYEVRTKLVYSQCRHTPDGMRAITDAFTATGFSDSPPKSIVPGSSAPGGRQLRNDKPQTR